MLSFCALLALQIDMYYFFNRGGFLGPCSASVALRGLSLVVVSRGYSSLRWLLLLRSTGSRVLGLSSGGTQA